MYIRENSWLARLAARKLSSKKVAMVIGHTIYLAGSSKEEFIKNKSWLLHELKHVEQYEKLGRIGFICRYFWYSIRVGYYKNPLEAEARAADRDESLLQKFKLAD